MNQLSGRPILLKQANLSLIRRAILSGNTATRAEISGETGISSTTVRTLLAEIMENGEIKSIGYDESSGGRKAERYALCPERYCGAAFCVTGRQLHGLLVNLRGEIVDCAELEVPEGDFARAVSAYLDKSLTSREIKSIGIGVPGIVEGGCYWRKNEAGELCKLPLGQRLAQKYGIPVVLENDLNAMTIGYGHRYREEHPGEDSAEGNLAYLHFEKGCVSAGFLADGRILRGAGNFAGELGLIPMKGGTLDERIATANTEEYNRLITQAVCWLCGILNPRCVVLGGPDFRRECLDPVRKSLASLLPARMATEILDSPDMWRDYHKGMAHLTAARIFDEIQFVKE